MSIVLWRSIKTKARDCVAALRAALATRQSARQTEARRKSAPDRAEKLLIGYLSAEQRATYTRYGWFVVRGESGRRYSIWKKDALYCNVCELGNYGQTVARLCAHPAIKVPMGDHLLTQKLMLEHHEAEFRRVAFRT